MAEFESIVPVLRIADLRRAVEFYTTVLGFGVAGGQHVPAIYGPSGDVTWDEADPTYSPEAAKRGVL